MFRKTKWRELNASIFNLATKESQFVTKEREIIEELLDKTDEVLVDLTIKYFNYLTQLKELEKAKGEITQK